MLRAFLLYSYYGFVRQPGYQASEWGDGTRKREEGEKHFVLFLFPCSSYFLSAPEKPDAQAISQGRSFLLLWIYIYISVIYLFYSFSNKMQLYLLLEQHFETLS